MSMDDLLAAGKTERTTSRWVALGQARLTAAGCPSEARLDLWAANGASDVITLQRADEMPAWLPDACLARGLVWHGVPLSGRRLQDPADAASLARIPALVGLLDAPRGIVVHCAAGMHRTGLFIYLLMRHAGLSSEMALRRLAQARPITAHELTRSTRRNGKLLDTADAVYLSQSG